MLVPGRAIHAYDEHSSELKKKIIIINNERLDRNASTCTINFNFFNSRI